MNFTPFEYQGQVYDLSHLEPFYYEYVQAARKSDETEKIYCCIIEFSGHCFTKSPNVHQQETLAHFSKELHYELNTHKGKTETRIFCFERYQYSFQLPQIMRELAQRKCFFTSDDAKFLTIEIEKENGQFVNYEIYFSLKKSKAKECDVYIYINSAYIRDNVHKAQSGFIRRQPVGFFTLLHNTLVNKKIKKPR